MFSLFRLSVIAILIPLLTPVYAFAQHEHDSDVKAPRIFLDKSPRVVEYQLKRLSNAQLLAIETSTDDKKYLPVLNAILGREGMSRAYRESALEQMVTINDSNAVSELAQAIQSVDSDDPAAKRTVRALARMMLEQDAKVLADVNSQLLDLAKSESKALAIVGFGGLLSSGHAETAWSTARAEPALGPFLQSIALIPSTEVRCRLHDWVSSLLKAEDKITQKQAIRALASIPCEYDTTFELVSQRVTDSDLRTAAIRTLLTVPIENRNPQTGLTLLKFLVEMAESTPPAERTTDSFTDAMQLVEELLTQAPEAESRSYRKRLRETVVRVVRVHTVEEEMRYDIPYFAVEAGRPVQVVLINEDLMPHNLVITVPGALKEVAEAGLAAGPNNGLDGKQYVPKSDQVLHATNMIPTLASERLTFDAPTEPGEYPYVCTFPRHWMRMYGVMVVVEDLDAWLKNPVEPKDPIGSNRSFVQSWKMDDFTGQLAQGLRGRSAKIGEKVFNEATCAQCHKVGEYGVGEVGPELSKSFTKFKNDDEAVLQEILDPSHRIDDKYAVHLILDADGQTYSGLVLAEDKEKVTLLENPEAQEPLVILKDDIEQMVKTSNSMMPKGLMDRFSKDEILELLSFLKELQSE